MGRFTLLFLLFAHTECFFATPAERQVAAWERSVKGHQDVLEHTMVERIKTVIHHELHEDLERCESQRRRFLLCKDGECVQDFIRPQVCVDWRPPSSCTLFHRHVVLLPQAIRNGKLRIDIMCGRPWCSLQLAFLKPFLRQLWNEIDFNILYVFKRVPTYAFGMDLRSQMIIRQDSWDGFLGEGEYAPGVENMEGSVELRGNVFELCARKLFPDDANSPGGSTGWPKWLAFTMCMESNFAKLGKNLARSCSQWSGLPFDEIEKCASTDGQDLLRSAYRDWVHERKDLMATARKGRAIHSTPDKGDDDAEDGEGGGEDEDGDEESEIALLRVGERWVDIVDDVWNNEMLSDLICWPLVALASAVPNGNTEQDVRPMHGRMYNAQFFRKGGPEFGMGEVDQDHSGAQSIDSSVDSSVSIARSARLVRGDRDDGDMEGSAWSEREEQQREEREQEQERRRQQLSEEEQRLERLRATQVLLCAYPSSDMGCTRAGVRCRVSERMNVPSCMDACAHDDDCAGFALATRGTINGGFAHAKSIDLPPSHAHPPQHTPTSTRRRCISTGLDERQQWRLVAERGQVSGLHDLSNL
jgi:hypothetical protein